MGRWPCRGCAGRLSRVALRASPSVASADDDHPARYGVSRAALYQKLNGLELPLGPALVRHSADRLGAVIAELGGVAPPWRPGYHVKILDGNHLSGTEHRLGVLRGTRAAALPGQVLAVLDPQLRLFLDLIPCADAYTQERALLEQVLPQVQPQDVWVGDRNLCTPKFLCGIADAGGCFAIREHAQLNIRYLTELRPMGRCPTGQLFEQEAEVSDDQTGRSVRVRRVLVKLDQPTRDGDTEVSVLTNLPAEVADAAAVAALYLERWSIEVAFGALTTALRCEVETLGYPKAALFCFAVAVLAANVLGAVQAALAAEHGLSRVEQELSVPKVAQQVSSVYPGMMIALPAGEWQCWGEMDLGEFCRWLRRLAGRVEWRKVKKAQRGPKKPTAPKPSAAQQRHVSTARLLQQRHSGSLL